MPELRRIAGCLAMVFAAQYSQVCPASDAPAEVEPLEQVIVVAPHLATRDRERVPADAQQATADEIARMQSLDLTDFLNRGFGGVNINHAQNNPLQPDFNFRGFTASPLLGLPQGLAVYQNGMRLNEPFGDTVNWDLVALSAVNDVQLLAGANPVFGLNTLGGALSLRMKDGFSWKGSSGEVYGGSFGRLGASAQTGGNSGAWGWYANADYFEEDGWRDHSQSDALRLYGALSRRYGDSSLDLSVAHVDSDLRGNGPAPVELLQEDRSAVFTYPDRTQNRLTQVILEGATALSGGWKLAANAYYRSIDTDSFNGDGTIFEECDFGNDAFLVEEGYDDRNGDGQCSAGDDDEIRLVLDQNGDAIEADSGSGELDAINNISRREQQSWGASVQTTLVTQLSGHRRNDLNIGAAYSDGETSFGSVVEVANLLEDRSTSRTGIYAQEFLTGVDSNLRTWSLYFIDTLDVSERLSLTVAGRYDDTTVDLQDFTGDSPELNGKHGFRRFNPSAGLTFRRSSALVMYASASQSARAPTAVELACADEEAPCNLPNAFLADPPLEQVVATSFEVGSGGRLGTGLDWHAGAFLTTNNDDILFQTTGGPQANVGFFANVGDTRRAGIELRLERRQQRFGWYAEYSFIDATFEDGFTVNSPHHPHASGEGTLQVNPGNRIPGIPQHQFNAGMDMSVSARVRIGADATWRSGVYLRGDEANLLSQTGSYFLVNLRGEVFISDAVSLFARVENLFGADYESFGLLGDPGEVFPGFEDPRFLGAGPPRGAWAGVRVKF